MTDLNNDVVGARIKLDVSKMPSAFKEIDEGVKKNKGSFESLNQELSKTENTYTQLAKAMDKASLNSDERRKKILDESNALVAQRRAAAELLTAKKQQLDATNQIVDSKLQSQLATQKKREDAIEQQEREHQKRMEALQSKANAAAVREGKVTGTGSDDATRERVLREEQNIRRSIAQQEEQESQRRIQNANREAQVRERALQEEQRIRREIDRQDAIREERLRRSNQITFSGDSSQTKMEAILSYAQKAVVHATAFQAVYATIHEVQQTFREGIIDLEANMAGYVQTNEHYFVSFNEGTNQMIMNTTRLHDETTKFIQTAHDLGANIMDVTESARLWGRMYKDVGIVQEMVRASTKLSTVDLVELEQATKGMEAVFSQYGVQIRNTSEAQVEANRVLDSWSSVAHNTMAPAKDLADAFERTGKIASETGVSFDFMNGLISSGVRNTALSGANLGNMWKTVLGTIRTDKAVNEIERLGVKTKELVDGTEQWRKAEDILLDLSAKVTDKNYDLTQSFQDISRGVFQFAKLAASLNIGDMLLGESASINSTGATMRYLQVQMDTIQRKAASTKASLLEIFNSAGDDGLRSSIKNALDVIDQLLIGITKLPKGTFEVTAGLVGLIALYKTVAVPLMAWKNAQLALTAAIEVNTIVTTVASREMIVLSAAAANAARMTAMATAGITLIVGAISVYLYSLGSAKEAERKHREEQEKKLSVQEQLISQAQRQTEFLEKVTRTHDSLTESLKNENLTAEQKHKITDQLTKVEQVLSDTIGAQGLQRLQSAGFTKTAVENEKSIMASKTSQIVDDTLKLIKLDQQETQSKITESQKRIAVIKAELAAQKGTADDFKKSEFSVPEKLADAYGVGGVFRWAKNLLPHDPAKKYDDLQSELDARSAAVDAAQTKLGELNEKIQSLSLGSLPDVLAGSSGKKLRDATAQAAYDTRKQQFDDEMNDFKHYVNMKKEGYVSAANQVAALKKIRDNFKDLDGRDLYGIDEDINRTGEGIGMKANGYGSGNEAFSFPLNDIDNSTKQAKSLIESASSLIDFYNVRKAALSDSTDTAAQSIDLYVNRQNALHESNLSMQKSVDILMDKQNTLDELFKSGTITLDEYNQNSEAVTTRLASLTKEIDANSVAWWNDAKAIKDVKGQQLKDSFDFSSKWIAHEKATREMSAKEEYEAWLRVQSRYIEGTELRKQSDEQVYAAKKALLSSEEKDLDKYLSKEKTFLDKAKKAELDNIEKTKKAFVEAQDEKIKAIDTLLQKMQETNQDEDYATKLKEKQDRLAVLQSAVGPEGIKERADTIKEISKMQSDHDKDMVKRGLEAQKKALQEEKEQKEKAFEKEKQSTEDHYTALQNAFDAFKDDVTTKAEAMKNFQIIKESEKNETILANLDKFILDYNTKMSSINNLSLTQEQSDLNTYNSNIDKWNSGDAATKDVAHAENERLRKKYNITDTGKIQHFKDGGVVKGRFGEATPVVAHAGEMYINPAQQSNLFKLLNFSMPKFDISMPSFDTAGKGAVQYITQHFDLSAGDVSLNDRSDIKSFWSERDTMSRRLQITNGVKTP